MRKALILTTLALLAVPLAIVHVCFADDIVNVSTTTAGFSEFTWNFVTDNSGVITCTTNKPMYGRPWRLYYITGNTDFIATGATLSVKGFEFIDRAGDVVDDTDVLGGNFTTALPASLGMANTGAIVPLLGISSGVHVSNRIKLELTGGLDDEGGPSKGTIRLVVTPFI